MKIGMIIPTNLVNHESVGQQFGSTIDVLQQRHELIYPPPDYFGYSRMRQREALKEMMSACDILLGTMDELTLQARQDIDKQIPHICFMIGDPPRGNIYMGTIYHMLRTTDVLLVNCTADREITHKFLKNAQVRVLPIPYTESDYYPLDEASRQSLRAKLGIAPGDKVLVYSGRMTLEKNVHSILKIFRVIERIIPNTRLIIAGRAANAPFFEFGACSLNISGTLERLIVKLGIDQDKVKFVGHKDRADLRGIYNIADAVINMTLHHDENFGLAQPEAMACGTPVIGTNWGGLKDTIVDGETGFKVSTMVTPSGIKLDWWEAINKIVSLLRDGSEHMRQKCHDRAYNKYSKSQYGWDLESVLVECHEKACGVSEPLMISDFAQQFWNSCAPVWGDMIAYRHGVSPYHMYEELIGPYTGVSQDHAAVCQRPSADQMLCLAAPVTRADEESVEINDPIFPVRITIPAAHQKVVYAVLEAMREEPAITVGRLTNNYLANLAGVAEALEWMIEVGLILRSVTENGVIPTSSIGGEMSLPLFSFQIIDSLADVVAIR
jgi:hypothetical protein